MPHTGLAIASGIAEGVDSAVKNLYAIQTAKQKLDMEKETHAADLKIKKAQLDKFELLYGPEQIAAEREKLKAETNAANALFNLRTVQISKEQKKQEQELEAHKRSILILDNALKKNGVLPPGMRIDSKGNFSMSGQKAELDLSSLFNMDEAGSSAPADNTKADWWNQ